MKAVVAAFNQEKALVGAFSVFTNLRMELFEALVKFLCNGNKMHTASHPSPAAHHHQPSMHPSQTSDRGTTSPPHHLTTQPPLLTLIKMFPTPAVLCAQLNDYLCLNIHHPKRVVQIDSSLKIKHFTKGWNRVPINNRISNLKEILAFKRVDIKIFSRASHGF